MVAKIPVALQLYSVRGEVAQSLPATIAEVARVGYEGAEPWGYGGDDLTWQGHSAAEIRKLYDDAGLICCGIHLQPKALIENLDRTIEFNQILGNNFLIIAGAKPYMDSREGIAELAAALDQAAARLAPLGMACGYHAHGFDFVSHDGAIAWDILFDSVGPEVIMQMDIGNCASGGGDPIAHLRRHPGRTRTLHLKDWGGGPEAVLGEGTMDWPTIWQVVDELHPVEWYVIEEGSADGMGFAIPERSLAALRAMGR